MPMLQEDDGRGIMRPVGDVTAENVRAIPSTRNAVIVDFNERTVGGISFTDENREHLLDQLDDPGVAEYAANHVSLVYIEPPRDAAEVAEEVLREWSLDDAQRVANGVDLRRPIVIPPDQLKDMLIDAVQRANKGR